MDNNSGTTPSDATRAAEETEARTPHQADRPPTEQEERDAPDRASAEAKKDYKEMSELGAEVKGEGEIP